jgi:hypothetical protein
MENWLHQSQVSSDFSVGSAGVNKLTDEEWEEIHKPKIKLPIKIELTIPELIEWAKWALKFGATDEANSIATICQQSATPQSVGQDSNYHF